MGTQLPPQKGHSSPLPHGRPSQHLLSSFWLYIFYAYINKVEMLCYFVAGCSTICSQTEPIQGKQPHIEHFAVFISLSMPVKNMMYCYVMLERFLQRAAMLALQALY